MTTYREAVDKEILNTVDTEISTNQQQSSSTGVPEPSDLGYSEGVYVASAYLCADMMDSSGLVRLHPPETVARVLKTYLQVAVRIIRNHAGHVRSFDGDRVMGVFAGDGRPSRAVKAAMQIKWANQELIQPALYTKFKSFKTSGWKLQAGCGIANGEALLIRAGIRENDDMVSIGRNANFAAKLSDLRHAPYNTRIGAAAYAMLDDAARLSSGKNM